MMEDDIIGLTALLEVVSEGFGFSRKLTTFPVSSTSKIPLLLVSMVTNGRDQTFEEVGRKGEGERGRG